MPFMGLRLPPSFISAHPVAAQNLRINANRLTTPFDIHATLRDIVDYTGDVAGANEEQLNRRGISLFREISKVRIRLGVFDFWNLLVLHLGYAFN